MSEPETATTQINGRNMSEAKIINKYTLVPVGLVVAAILATATVVMAFNSKAERITVLETQAIQASKERAQLSAKFDKLADKLDDANLALIRIQAKLGVKPNP